jgi:hypothetical protein
MQRQIAVAFLLVGFVSSMFSEPVYTKRKNNYVREGPGSFYELLVVLPENSPLTVLERSGNWLKVQLPEKRIGWIAANCITAKRNDKVAPASLENIWSSPKASKAGIAAAIKGFAGKHAKTKPGSVDLVLKYSEKPFQPGELGLFNNELQQQASKNKGKVEIGDLDLKKMEYDAGLDEQKIGVGMAARLVERGIVSDAQLNKYVNLVCATIAMYAPAYDWNFTVFVLEDSTVNGFATPGGYLFLTLGAVKQCSDESELAGIIAHEMSHVIRRHGMQEMTKRSVEIQADEAMSELQDETEGSTQDETDLEEIMEDMYQQIISKRLLSYELEADKLSSVLCANAGYDPFGIVRACEKMAIAQHTNPDIFDPAFMAPDELRARSTAVRGFVSRKYEETYGIGLMQTRFNASMGFLK